MTLLERYFRRLGIPAPAAGSDPVETLDNILSHHAEAIPFENLDPLLGRGASLDPGVVATKLLDARRGGFCHEHALLVQQVLRELGFKCFPVLARVYRDPTLTTPSGPTHHLTLVVLGEQLRLVDPGFGGGTPTVSLPVEVGAQVGEFRLVSAPETLPSQLQARDVSLLLQRRSGEGVWHNLYGFDTVPAQPQDIEVSNWYVSTSPQVMFTRYPVLARPLRDGTRHSLRGRVLRSVGPEGEHREEIGDPGRLGQVLGEVFGLELIDAEVGEVWERSGEVD
ncbi:Arylamine N-acetyltransferase [Corynebacterium occultum]|uniref:Arylamine N-acetyltransferase n=1 Tax=Corynebacterium occultum TaxID=2675219 RepID=A0A6B8W7R1_9CORY|nr:arylamine N-acetyltransferase [Corynebacterium occultum]QGU07967.1 Arylamine N-acetyltransferase [Corynebacterium occultum]